MYRLVINWSLENGVKAGWMELDNLQYISLFKLVLYMPISAEGCFFVYTTPNAFFSNTFIRYYGGKKTVHWKTQMHRSQYDYLCFKEWLQILYLKSFLMLQNNPQITVLRLQ